ncbi:hypothetical protein A2U01_0096843, partial [Trifolium medium]|nr:hypothetical protein [Trifolium medium]
QCCATRRVFGQG